MVPVERFGNTFELTGTNTDYSVKKNAYNRKYNTFNYINLSLYGLDLATITSLDKINITLSLIKIAATAAKVNSIQRILVDKNNGTLNPVETYRNLE